MATANHRLPDLNALNSNELKALIFSQHEQLLSKDEQLVSRDNEIVLITNSSHPGFLHSHLIA